MYLNLDCQSYSISTLIEIRDSQLKNCDSHNSTKQYGNHVTFKTVAKAVKTQFNSLDQNRM